LQDFVDRLLEDHRPEDLLEPSPAAVPQASGNSATANTSPVSPATTTTDLVKLYLRDIGKTPLLTAEQEVDLAKQIEAGVLAKEKLKAPDLSPDLRRDYTSLVRAGEDAKEQLWTANLRLVVSKAKRRHSQNDPTRLLDLIQEGNIGLLRAVEMFDYTKGYKFSTYAVRWIRQAIGAYIGDQDRTIRIPLEMGYKINKYTTCERDLTDALGREPTVEEVAKKLKIPLDKAKDYKAHQEDAFSIQTIVGEEDGAELGDFIADDDTATPADVVILGALRDDLDVALSSFEPLERQVVRKRFGLEDGRIWTTKQIGQELGLEPAAVRKLAARVLNEIRTSDLGAKLQEYLQD
jgi:RNA polymerase primary sigma factor